MRYLVSTDGSEESNEAVTYAARQAATFDASLEIVHVITPETEVLDGEIVLQATRDAADRGRDILEAAADRASETADLDVETTLVTGRPAAAIAERADEIDADAIFVGHRGLSTEQEEVVGSVAKSVVSKASVPVTVVR